MASGSWAAAAASRAQHPADDGVVAGDSEMGAWFRWACRRPPA